jgi:putative transposase
VLVGDIETRLKELLVEKATEMGIEIKTLEVMPDHVHVFVSSDPHACPSRNCWMVERLYLIEVENRISESEKRLPTLWTRAYYIESVGHLSEATIRKYIEDQKNV